MFGYFWRSSSTSRTAATLERDIELAGVRIILLIENSVRFYSSYLPLLYMELMRQNQSLMVDGVNAKQRLRRMRARPKILLAESFEEGWELFERYRDHVLGIITDARFPREGTRRPGGGSRVRPSHEDDRSRHAGPDPVLRRDDRGEGRAPRGRLPEQALSPSAGGVAPVHPGEPRFRRFRLRPARRQGGARVSATWPRWPAALASVPDDSLRYHATRNHFSNWCMARTEFALAAKIRPVRVSEFESIEMLRGYLIDVFSRLRSGCAARRGGRVLAARVRPDDRLRPDRLRIDGGKGAWSGLHQRASLPARDAGRSARSSESTSRRRS